MQYFFTHLSMLMNYKNERMKGIIAPTDSRFREDLRIYEEGNFEEADRVKFDIEEEQRRKRKI